MERIVYYLTEYLFLNESVMERSDKYKVQIDNKNGMITYDENMESKRTVKLPPRNEVTHTRIRMYECWCE